MNEIFLRRSIRSYNDKIVSDEDVLLLIKAGMNAPSAKNSRPSEYIILDDTDILKSLADVTPYTFMLAKCNKAIVVFGSELTEYWQQDMAASTQNILLEATSIGISTCWCGIAPILDFEKRVIQLLNIPVEKRVLSIISLGYTEKEKKSNDFFDESKIFKNII